ncbi:MAG: hypothetical protein DRO04_00930 [Candidatus Iainarchaeum archaeon]|uniref:Uncharacterized protein n=1 Tax=Candidatus Iainarchaeum sp. TaxID=3101447 RepID=A0A497JIT3_9ARCH|nr:MAG: hypothetical protein DRO04_00930 [Candidatus Diapherotrites archaeon]
MDIRSKEVREGLKEIIGLVLENRERYAEKHQIDDIEDLVHREIWETEDNELARAMNELHEILTGYSIGNDEERYKAMLKIL